jgi:hypothetical protein
VNEVAAGRTGAAPAVENGSRRKRAATKGHDRAGDKLKTEKKMAKTQARIRAELLRHAKPKLENHPCGNCTGPEQGVNKNPAPDRADPVTSVSAKNRTGKQIFWPVRLTCEEKTVSKSRSGEQPSKTAAENALTSKNENGVDQPQQARESWRQERNAERGIPTATEIRCQSQNRNTDEIENHPTKHGTRTWDERPTRK